MSERKSSDKKIILEDALRKEVSARKRLQFGYEEELEELINSEATKNSDFVEEICDLMSRESECCGSVKGVDGSFTKHYQSFVRCKWRDVFVYGGRERMRVIFGNQNATLGARGENIIEMH